MNPQADEDEDEDGADDGKAEPPAMRPASRESANSASKSQAGQHTHQHNNAMQCQIRHRPGPINEYNRVVTEVRKIERRIQEQKIASSCMSRQVGKPTSFIL